MPAPQASSPASGTPGRPERGPQPRAADLPDFPDGSLRLWGQLRKLIVAGIISVFVITPAVQLVAAGGSVAKVAFLVTGTVVFVGLACWIAILPGPAGSQPVPWAWLGVIVVLGIALFAVGRVNWLVVLAVAAACCGRYSATPRPALLGAGACTAAGLVVAGWRDLGYGNTLAVAAVPAMAAFFAYGAGKRNDMVAMLRRTRAELAMVAVAEERLRIARDLHDLLGHSLSLITLKAELARRLMETDASRAAHEIAELEEVARRSLSEVRGAVTGYRQPELHAELAAARQLLTAAGIACRITAPDPLELGQEADALLAWTVREAATNVVRHSGADRVTITVRSGRGGASVEVTDDGAGPGASAGAREQLTGQPASRDPAGKQPAGGYPGVEQPAGWYPGVEQPGVEQPAGWYPGMEQPRVGHPAGKQPGAGHPGGHYQGGEQPGRERGGTGLAGLAERVARVGGQLTAEAARPSGFRLRVGVPAAAPAADPSDFSGSAP